MLAAVPIRTPAVLNLAPAVAENSKRNVCLEPLPTAGEAVVRAPPRSPAHHHVGTLGVRRPLGNFAFLQGDDRAATKDRNKPLWQDSIIILVGPCSRQRRSLFFFKSEGLAMLLAGSLLPRSTS